MDNININEQALIICIDSGYGLYTICAYMKGFGRMASIFCSNSEYSNHLTEPPVDDSTSDGISTGAAAGLAVALTLLVALPVGVVLGCSGAWCIWRRGRGPSGHGTEVKMEQLQGAIYEVPGPGPVDVAIPLTDNQAYGQVKKN